MIPKSLLATAALVVALVSARWFEHGDYVDPVRGRRHCAAPPDAIRDWSYNRRAPKPGDVANLERWLQGHGGDVNRLFGAFCWSPLHSAARFGRADLASLLIAHGADVRAADEPAGNTPLHLAAQSGQVPAAKVLMAHGASVNAANRWGRTPLHDAASGLAGTSDLEGRVEMARLLLANGANVDARERGNGRTPLDEAAAASPANRNNERMIELLLAAGAKVDTGDVSRPSALQQAAVHGNLAGVRTLLDHGADPNGADRDSTALAAAAYQGHVDVVALLLARGADASRSLAGSRLEAEGAPLAMVFLPTPGAARDRDARSIDIATQLLDHGAIVDARDREGRTVLHETAARGQLRAAELLLSRGATIDAADASGYTPLHLAVKEGHTAVVARLLERGASVGARTKDGATAIDLAAGNGPIESLLRHHAQR